VAGLTLTYTGDLTITTCWCGIAMALPADLYRHAQTSKGFVCWCPLGHEWVVSKNEADRQRERADEAERQLALARRTAGHLRDTIAQQERREAALRGWITRYRNRIAAGVCPVDDCRRNFSNVQRHIERMHPDWAHEHPEVLA
jgi:Mg2+ and Co2+ transporter CorA